MIQELKSSKRRLAHTQDDLLEPDRKVYHDVDKRGRPAVLSVRITKDQYEKLYAIAKAQNKSLSSFIRLRLQNILRLNQK